MTTTPKDHLISCSARERFVDRYVFSNWGRKNQLIFTARHQRRVAVDIVVGVSQTQQTLTWPDDIEPKVICATDIRPKASLTNHAKISRGEKVFSITTTFLFLDFRQHRLFDEACIKKYSSISVIFNAIYKQWSALTLHIKLLIFLINNLFWWNNIQK